MGKRYKNSIRKFYAGIEDDPRTESTTGFQIARNFDIYTYPGKLVPLKGQIVDENDGSTSDGMRSRSCVDFMHQPFLDNKVFALGTKTDGTGTQVMYKDMITDAAWQSLGDNSLARFPGCFTNAAGIMYFFSNTNKIMSAAVGIGITVGTGTLTQTVSSVAQGVTAKDGNTYIAYNRFLVLADTGSVSEVYGGPSGYDITSVCNYGTYVAIAFVPEIEGNSIVHIWDLVSTNPVEVIDWGPGRLSVLENIDGRLVGVSDEYLSDTQGNDRGKMVIREWSGGNAVITKEIESKYVGGYVGQAKAVKGGRLRFPAAVPQSSTERLEGIWSYGRKSSSYPTALTLELVNPLLTTNAGIQGFYQLGNFDIIAHSADGAISSTSGDELYADASYESQIITGGDSSIDKRLNMVSATFEPLPSGASVTLRERIQDVDAYTTIGTQTTEGSVSKRVISIEPTMASLPTAKEYQLRVESSGGAVITGIHSEHTELTEIG